MRFSRLSAAGLVVVLFLPLGACNSVGRAPAEVDTQALRKLKRIGVASFVAWPTVRGRGKRSGPKVEGELNRWGAASVQNHYGEVRAAYGKALRLAIADDATVVAAPSYASAVRVKGDWVAPSPLAALAARPEDDDHLGAIAREADVDAVLVTTHVLSLRNVNNTLGEYICDHFTVALVDREGSRIWSQEGHVRSLNLPPSWQAMKGEFPAEHVVARARDAMVGSTQEVGRYWRHKRDNAELESPWLRQKTGEPVAYPGCP